MDLSKTTSSYDRSFQLDDDFIDVTRVFICGYKYYMGPGTIYRILNRCEKELGNLKLFSGSYGNIDTIVSKYASDKSIPIEFYRRKRSLHSHSLSECQGFSTKLRFQSLITSGLRKSRSKIMKFLKIGHENHISLVNVLGAKKTEFSKINIDKAILEWSCPDIILLKRPLCLKFLSSLLLKILKERYKYNLPIHNFVISSY